MTKGLNTKVSAQIIPLVDRWLVCTEIDVKAAKVTAIVP
jgi:hypothetical protein